MQIYPRCFCNTCKKKLDNVTSSRYNLEIIPHIFNPHSEECVICFAQSELSKATWSFWRELEKLLTDIGFVKMRGTFSSDKIFFKPYYHNNSVAVDITLIFDK